LQALRRDCEHARLLASERLHGAQYAMRAQRRIGGRDDIA
jgi:hypothetical protein